MITPVNNHVVIEPLAHDAFIATERDTYQEIGTVVAIPLEVESIVGVRKGDKVYFDAWLAAKYPKNDKEHYWLVKWDDIRAVEYVEPEPVQE